MHGVASFTFQKFHLNRITTVAEAVAPTCKLDLIGVRPGEKIHEEMITATDSLNTYDCGQYYTIVPSVADWNLETWKTKFNAKKVAEGFQYNSGENADWLNVDQIRTLVKKHVDPNFEV